MKRVISVILVLCVFSCLVSCQRKDSQLYYPTGNIEACVYEESTENTSFNANIYIVDSLSGMLECKSAKIEMPDDISPLNALIEAVISQNDSHISLNVKFENALLSNKTCLIFLSGKFPEVTEWFKLEGVLLATLKDFCNVDTVELFLNDGIAAYNGMPVSAARYTGDLPDSYVEEKLAELNTDTPLKSSFLAFIPDYDSEFFYISTVGFVPYNASDSTRTKIKKTLEKAVKELTQAYNRHMQPGIDACCTIIFNSKRTESGNFTVDIKLDQKVMLRNDNLYIAKLIALFLYVNVPRIESLNFTVKDAGGDIEYSPSFKEALHGLGTDITAYYPIHVDSTLETVHMYIESESCYNAKALLEKVLSETSDTLMPNISDRLQDVVINGDTVFVNFLPNTSSKITLDFINDTRYYDSPEMRERLFVYSIVNTLTELPMVEYVAFFEDKKTMPRLVNIYFERPLMRNPGLIAE